MKYNNISELFVAIANAIRGKAGHNNPIVAEDFPAAIEALQAGDGENVGFAESFKFILDNSGCVQLFAGSTSTTAPFFDTSSVTNMHEMFACCYNLIEIPHYDTSKVTSMHQMFYECLKLKEIPHLNTSKVVDLGGMFYACANLTSVPLLDTSAATNMSYMFTYCDSLTEVPHFNTANVTSMEDMFYHCDSLTEVPHFNTSKVTNMSKMFDMCESLTEVPLFDTKNVTRMSYMFRGCSSLTRVPRLDIRNATEAWGMFLGCEKLTECFVCNINANFDIPDSDLTLDSLIHLISELRGPGEETRLLSIGEDNIAKLANVYVRTISVTDEMRAEDDLIDEKLPFEVCESTDDGAMLITNYVPLKNWSLE